MSRSGTVVALLGLVVSLAGAALGLVVPPGAPSTPDDRLPITRVSVPRIGLDSDVITAGAVLPADAVTWDVPEPLIGHAEGTAGAGAAGNAVLVGGPSSREVGNVFQHLDVVQVGDEIRVYSGPRLFVYHVVSTRDVAREEVSAPSEEPAPSVSLIAASGPRIPGSLDYARRLVVRAELLTAPEAL